MLYINIYKGISIVINDIDEEAGFILTPKQSRIVDGVCNKPEKPAITYSHSIMCQTSLPLKDMKDQRQWISKNGASVIMLEAGKVLHPDKDEFIELGLPFGAKPRLILLYLNQQAILKQSPVIEVEDSLGAFIRRIGLDSAPNGRLYREVKDQLGRLAASRLYIGNRWNGRTVTEKRDIVQDIDVFFPKDSRQRILWPNSIRLSDEYFNNLALHAVPLDETALYLLKDSALELDIYAMLAERLHRISNDGKGQFISWAQLYEQYGGGYSQIRQFRSKFLHHLQNVCAVYPSARIEHKTSDKGMAKGLQLYHSPPPVIKKSVAILKSSRDGSSD